MAEPGRFSLEWLVIDQPARWATLIAALLALAVALFFTRETLSKIPEFIETSYGYDAQLRASLSNRSLVTGGLPVTFVDIDAAAIKSWGDATRTMPRRKLAEIVDFVAKQQPKVIFLDFDLSGTSSNDGDREMQSFLTNYPPTSPPLLLTTEIRQAKCPGESCGPDRCQSKTDGEVDLVETSASPFESTVAKKPNMIWVSSVFFPDADGVVRSWRLWEYVCRDNQVRALPSAQLAAAALATETPDGKERLEKYLRSIEAPTNAVSDSAWPPNREAREALIPFLIGASPKSQVSDWFDLKFRYQRVNAENMLADQVAESAFKDRVVVIGASYGPDKLGTPFGRMPGAALMANAIAVAPAVLANAPRPYLVTLLTLLLAAAYGFLAKVFRAMPAALLILALSYVWLTLATYWLNPSDAAHTVSMALVVLGAFLAFESVIEIVLDLIEGRGFSAFLRQGTHRAGGK